MGATDTGKSAGTLSPVFFYAVAGSFVNENSVLPVASKSMKAVIDKPRRAAAAFIAALICLFTRIVMLLSDFINSVDINKKFSYYKITTLLSCCNSQLFTKFGRVCKSFICSS